MERLQGEGVRGADLVFACVGPALEIFSRYSRVETAEGKEIRLSAYLERVWEVVGRTALENVLGTEEAQARNGQTGVLARINHRFGIPRDVRVERFHFVGHRSGFELERSIYEPMYDGIGVFLGDFRSFRWARRGAGER